MTQNSKFSLFNLVTQLLPQRNVAMRLRSKVLRWCGAEIGDSVYIAGGVRFYGNGRVVIGNNVVLRGDVRIESNVVGGRIEIMDDSEVNHGSYLAANGGSSVVIEQNCRIAHFVSLKTSCHKIDVEGVCIAGEMEFKNIRVGAGSWVCAGAIILPGVSIGRRNVIAAGAVVLHDTVDGVLMCGAPAVEKKKYV